MQELSIARSFTQELHSWCPLSYKLHSRSPLPKKLHPWSPFPQELHARRPFANKFHAWHSFMWSSRLVVEGENLGQLSALSKKLAEQGIAAWYALCIGGGYDEDEGEDEGRKVATVDHGPGPA